MAFYQALELATEEWELEELWTSPIEPEPLLSPQIEPPESVPPNQTTSIRPKPNKPVPKWTNTDDELLKIIVPKLKPDWKRIAGYFPGRPKSVVRRRWENRFDPQIKKAQWTEEEDTMIVALVNRIGPVWKEIATHLQGRPPDVVKNRYYGHIKRKHVDDHQLPPVTEVQLEQELDWEDFLSLKDDVDRDEETKVTEETPTVKSVAQLQDTIAKLQDEMEHIKVKIKELEQQKTNKTENVSQD